jgi:iron-sulfur cluster assembly accessory protein
MITLSPSATKQIDMLCKINSAYVRLALRAGGCAGYSYDWSLDTPTQDDYVVAIGEHGLIVDFDSKTLLGDVSLNFIQSVAGSSWEINSTAASASCGCGTSVAIKQDGGGTHG